MKSLLFAVFVVLVAVDPAPSPSPGPRVRSASVVHGEKMFLYGGAGGVEKIESYGDLWVLEKNEWKWLSGSMNSHSLPVYGEKNEATEEICPGAYVGAAMKAVNDSLFLFTSVLWRFDLNTERWSWIGGSSDSLTPEFGPLGAFIPNVRPGARSFPAVTTKGKFLYLFGGSYRNDLWSFDTDVQLWAWLSGETTSRTRGIYDESADSVHPGGRSGAALEPYRDVFFIVAGNGLDANGISGDLSDVWTYSPRENRWRWVFGSSLIADEDGQPRFRSLSFSTRLVDGMILFPVTSDPGNIPQSSDFSHRLHFFSFQTNDIEALDTELSVPGETLARNNAGGIVKNRLVMFGGETGNASDLWSVDVRLLRERTPAPPCPPGTYNPGPNNATTCLLCSVGKFSNVTGSSVCRVCQPGYQASAMKSACEACSAGKFKRDTDIHCQDCLSGKYQIAAGKEVCDECPRASWTEGPGAIQCQSCFIGALSSEELWRYRPKRPKRYSDCFCKSGFYGTPYVSGGGTCEPCLQGTFCPTNASIPIVCNPPEACLSGSLCAVGYSGPYCGDCDPNSFYRSNGKCEMCTYYSGMSVYFYFMGLLVCLYVLLENSTPGHQKTHVLSLSLFWLQILDLLSSTVHKWPPSISWMFNLFTLLNFDIEIFQPECSFSMRYWTKWHLKMSVGLVLGAMQLYIFIYQEHRLREDNYIFDRRYLERFLESLKTRAKNAVQNPKSTLVKSMKTFLTCPFTCILSLFKKLRLLVTAVKNLILCKEKPSPFKDKTVEEVVELLKPDRYEFRRSRYVYAYGLILNGAYILIAKTSFEMLQCDSQSTGIYTMRVYVGQQCLDAYWYQVATVNVVFSSYWLLGFPLALTYLLVKNKDELDTEDFVKNYGSFLDFYSEGNYLWPVVEVLFKLCAVVTIKVVWFYYPSVGFLLFLVLVIAYDVCLLVLKPYKSYQSSVFSGLWSLLVLACVVLTKFLYAEENSANIFGLVIIAYLGAMGVATLWFLVHGWEISTSKEKKAQEE